MTLKELKAQCQLEKRELVVVREEEFEEAKSRGFFPERHIRHLRKAKRIKRDIRLLLTDGEANFAFSSLVNEKVAIEKTFYLPKATEKVFLFQAIIHPANLEFLVAKGVELGVDEIIFFYGDFSQNYKLNLKRLALIVENAQMQSWNFYRPKIKLHLEKLYQLVFPENTTFYYGNWQEKKEVQKNLKKNLAFINGPEGGFSPKEEAFLAQKCLPLWLSHNTLRAETAAICAIYQLKALTE